jgi:hypothetical protein
MRSRPQTAVAAVALAVHASLLLGGCGGGGSGAASTSSAPSAAASAPTPADDTMQRRSAMAEKVYLGVPRVPAGFVLDAAPAGATGPVATQHLKNTDLGATAPTPRHEVCSDDPAEALAWSELRASWQGTYSDLVETNASERVFEFVRVPRSDTTARLRHRIFKCAYLDRAGTDLDAGSGAAGVIRPTPVSLEALKAAAEYLWQFTAFNNADHVVLTSSATTASSGQAAWQIEMARLTRGATAADCDRIDRLAWTHVADLASGALTRRLETLETFRARRENGVVQVCPN